MALLGKAAMLLSFDVVPNAGDAHDHWHTYEHLPERLSILFEAAATPPMTNEQSIRGRDRAMDWALLVTGYNSASVASLGESELSEAGMSRHGTIAGYVGGIYRMDVALTATEAAQDAARHATRHAART